MIAQGSAKTTQAEKLAVRDRTFVVMKVERGEMEVVVRVSVLVVDGGLYPTIRNP